MSQAEDNNIDIYDEDSSCDECTQLQTENEVLSKPAYVVCPKCLTKIKCV